MAEIYPSDSELLNLLSDAETGVEYIPTGTAPYYLHFRKLLQRLLLATRRANDLRVFDEGGLTFGVKPGKFFDGNSLVEYAGSTGNVLADDKPTIYVSLDSDGSLHFTSYLAFFDQGFGQYVHLAKIATSGGDITSLEDCRDEHSIAMPQKRSVGFEDHTEWRVLSHAESGSVHTNKDATGMFYLGLPTYAQAGTKFTFFVYEAQELRIDPVAASIIDEVGSTAGFYRSCSTVGASITLVSNEDGDWLVVAKNGSWPEAV